jgi:diazepam-binding inhibitor (GABA receptor modulator, acyl-CoA-binding protein)
MVIDSFEAAVAAVSALDTDPGNDVKLRLYALYKQATEGAATGSRPSRLNPVARAKYDAWAAVGALSGDDARRAYVEEVSRLTPG